MLIALNKIETIITFLEKEVVDHKISDFKIFLKPNLEISIIVVCNAPTYKPKELEHQSIILEVIGEEERNHDPYYKQIFTETNSRVELGFKRRFSSFSNQPIKLKSSPKTPVVTFYSYKGGMGRSTSLVAYAMYCAKHEQKKIVILDCDFEAPGYLNFFNLSQNHQLLNGEINGIVEYLLDIDFEKNKVNLKDNYTVLVDKRYSGKGEIRIMPAGNLNEDRAITNLQDFEGNIISTHKDHYIETLARVDTSRSDFIVNHFNNLLLNIESEIKPDLILIDSRTGFNDIFGITALRLSKCIVAFFGSSEQTKPGLKFLLDKYNKIKQIESERKLNLILVNAILPKTDTQFHFNLFRSDVENYLLEKKEETLPDSYFISRNPILESVGITTKNENKFEQEFIEYIDNIETDKNALEHLELFKGISYKIKPDKTDEKVEQKGFADFKSEILNNLDKLLKKEGGKVRLFAEDEPVSEDLFFFRECMNEIISKPSKFIISGFKGTGKTYLYKAFKNEAIKNELVRRAKRESENFIFLDIISISNVAGENYKKHAFENHKMSSIEDKAYFFKRLWTVYFWNSIMLDSETLLGYKSTFSEEVKPITIFEETNQRFVKIIEDTNLFLKVENDLNQLDSFLSDRNINLIILFDQIDKDIHPNNWREIVSPLVKYWERNPFKRIYPKIFVRTDLFRRLELNNSLNIKKNNTISIEWEREELYSYFFKLILATTKESFFNIIKGSGLLDEKVQEELKGITSKYNQVPLNRHFLEPLVTLMFGKEVRAGKVSLGDSYEYFYFNFKNANETISIRPFINLMSYSISEAVKRNNLISFKNTLPILNSDFYLNREFRDFAVGEHFEDLTNEGNRELNLIVQYLRDNTEYKQQYLTATELQAFLNGAIENYNDLANKNWKELKELLEANGIIAEHIKPDGYIYYFAMLYKFWLGLKNRKYQFGSKHSLRNQGTDFEKIVGHFKTKLKIESIYQQSLIGTMIFEATKRNWFEVFNLTDYKKFLEEFQKKGIIELKDDAKFRLIRNWTKEDLNSI